MVLLIKRNNVVQPDPINPNDPNNQPTLPPEGFAPPNPVQPQVAPQPSVQSPPNPVQPQVAAQQPTPPPAQLNEQLQPTPAHGAVFGVDASAQPAPQPMAVSGSELAKAAKSRNKTVIVIVAIIVSIAVLVGGAIFAMQFLSDEKVSKSDLVQENYEGVSFERPKQWIESKNEDIGVVFTDKGKTSKESDMVVGVEVQDIGVDIDSLTDSEKAEIESSIVESFSGDEVFGSTNGPCSSPSDSDVQKVDHDNYPIAYRITVKCDEVTDKKVKGTVALIFGIRKSEVNMILIAAADENWNKSSDAFEQMLSTLGN